VDTTEQVISTGRRRRRQHSAFFKAEAVGACQQPGISIAAVALSRGLNANLLRRWVHEAERGGTPIAIQPTTPRLTVEGGEDFMPITLSSGATESTIRIEVRRGSRTVSVQWPASAARECALLLRALMR
jgi:transposase